MTTQLSKPFIFSHRTVLVSGFADVDATWRWGPHVSLIFFLSLLFLSFFPALSPRRRRPPCPSPPLCAAAASLRRRRLLALLPNTAGRGPPPRRRRAIAAEQRPAGGGAPRRRGPWAGELYRRASSGLPSPASGARGRPGVEAGARWSRGGGIRHSARTRRRLLRVPLPPVEHSSPPSRPSSLVRAPEHSSSLRRLADLGKG